MLVKELIGKVQSGECGEIISQTIEKEYGVKVGDDDDEGAIRNALVVTGLAKFMEHGAESSRRWMLRYSTEVRTLPDTRRFVINTLNAYHRNTGP